MKKGKEGTCEGHGCGAFMGLLILLLGIVFLLVDLGVWTFWGIQWWSALFIIVGFGLMCMMGSCCGKDCKPKK